MGTNGAPTKSKIEKLKSPRKNSLPITVTDVDNMNDCSELKLGDMMQATNSLSMHKSDSLKLPPQKQHTFVSDLPKKIEKQKSMPPTQLNQDLMEATQPHPDMHYLDDIEEERRSEGSSVQVDQNKHGSQKKYQPLDDVKDDEEIEESSLSSLE